MKMYRRILEEKVDQLIVSAKTNSYCWRINQLFQEFLNN